MMTKDSLLELMQRFVSGGDRSMALGEQIEVALAEVFGEQEPFAELSLALASYRPGGGEYLYDEERIVKWMRLAVEAMKAESQSKPGGDL